MTTVFKIGDTMPVDGRSGLQDGHTHPTWYALRTPPQKEKAARMYLDAQGIHAFYPNEDRVKYRHGRKITRNFPIVSGYVFARFEGEPRWHVIRSRPFFIGVVSLGGLPFPIPRPTIKRLRGLTVEEKERRRELRELREAARRALEPREGEQAQILDGPLAGFLVDVTKVAGGRVFYMMSGGLKGQADVSSLERKLSE